MALEMTRVPYLLGKRRFTYPGGDVRGRGGGGMGERKQEGAEEQAVGKEGKKRDKRDRSALPYQFKELLS